MKYIPVLSTFFSPALSIYLTFKWKQKIYNHIYLTLGPYIYLAAL